MNFYIIKALLEPPKLINGILLVIFIFSFIIINIRPINISYPSKRLKILSNGAELLIAFIITVIINSAFCIYLILNKVPQNNTQDFVIYAIIAVITETFLFWNGILKVYFTSVQLGIKLRIIGIATGLIPLVHLIVLIKIISVTSAECKTENNFIKLNENRKAEKICGTKYPILLVHGVFFRDMKLLNYWGRIPTALIGNGATIYYGEQQSAASVKKAAAELATRIREIVEQTGCEKINVLAHSKGGLDMRYAISKLGISQYIASLTTINTPHQGCAFAEYLLNKAPESLKNKIADTYNNTLQNLGEKEPNFIEAVSDLTIKSCKKLNEEAPNAENVFYQSTGSKLKKARNGKFPLNISYPMVSHFDGKNDGLVPVTSAKWGENFIYIEPTGKRGISHADMIDLNRENIPGFDVREFYIQLISDLKKRGF